MSYHGSYEHCTFFVRAYVPAFQHLSRCSEFKQVPGVKPEPATGRYVIISDSHTGIVDGGFFYDVPGGGRAAPVRKKELELFKRAISAYMGSSRRMYYDFLRQQQQRTNQSINCASSATTKLYT
jgi:phosphoglucomutase